MHEEATRNRDGGYAAVIRALSSMDRTAGRDERMQCVVDALWDVFGPDPMSWIGFYLDQPDQPDDRRMTLGPRRDTPACSPIGLHGVCGQSLRESVIRIVRDVRDLGPDYIACDPRDRSEIVVPLLDDRERCWGVLDVDSWSVGTFDESDAHRLCDVLESAGFRVNRRIQSDPKRNEQRPGMSQGAG